MQLLLVRHGATKGNREGRYVGSTDEELLDEAVVTLQKQRDRNHVLLSQVEMVAVSPMKRCRHTADLLFPGVRQLVVKAFQECNFGEFEYRNFQELNGNPAYQRFIDTFGKSGFPGGEDRETFQRRCVAGFEKIMPELENMAGGRNNPIALVVHGGTIMALLDWYSSPHGDYYDWQTHNGMGYLAEVVRNLETGNWELVGIKEWK